MPPPVLGDDPASHTTNLKLVLGTAIIIVGLGVYTILALFAVGSDAANMRGAIILLCTPIATALFASGLAEPVLSALNRKQDAQTQQLRAIKTQTNGDSITVVKRAVKDALEDHEQERNDHGR